MVSKGDVFEMSEKLGKSETVHWLKSKDECFEKATHGAYRGKVERVYAEFRNLNKNKGKIGHEARLESVKCQSVKYPQVGIPQKRKLDDVDFAKNSAFLQKIDTLNAVNQDLAYKVHRHKMENESLTQAFGDMNAKCNSKQQSGVNLTRRKESLMNTINMKKEKHLRNVVLRKNAPLKRQRLCTAYYERKATQLMDDKTKVIDEVRSLKELHERAATDSLDKDDIIKQLQQDKTNLIAENEYLREMCKATVVTFNEDTRTYTSETQQCVYSLLEHNVSTTKIPLVIRDVLQLVHVKASHLPSKSTCNNMNIQRLHLAQQQLGEEFSSRENTCILSDETSKFWQKIEGFHAVDNTGRTWVLGLREMATKSGQSALDTFKEILGDIEDSFSSAEGSVADEILMNIVTTMSDRASTQKKFNDLLEEFRTEVLKRNIDWEALDENEKHAFSRLLNFFCSLHVLVHLAEAAEKALIEIDKLLFEDAPIYDATFRKSSESGTTRLVRCCSKAFARGGDEKNGVHGPFKAYVEDFLRQNGLVSLPLERFRGNRFNILFSNAAVVNFLSEKFLDFLDGGDSNRLLKAVKHDLNVPEYRAGCRALGLISELITKPLWCLIEDTSINILDMQDNYTELLNFMDTLDMTQFISGRALLSFANLEKLETCPIVQALIRSSELDEHVVSVLSVMIPALRNVLLSMFKEFLPGGQWHNCTAEIKEKAKATPKHNKFSETVFGQLDRLLREKPNVSVLTSEATIAFCHNKTLSWIMSKSKAERDAICTSARKSTPELRRKFKERSHAIRSEVKRIIETKIQMEKEQAKRKLRKQEDLVIQIQHWGLWQTREEVNSALTLVKTKGDKLSALKAQLNFRKQILKQSSDTKTYSFSKKEGSKRVNLSPEELAENVKKLVVEACSKPAESSTDIPLLPGKKVRHAVNGNDKTVWCIGQVISQVPGYSEWYNIKYSGDSTIHTYQLMKAYGKGDLQIIV